MSKTRQLLVTLGLAAAAALVCSGCLAMMIPGLAYSGYKYEHDKNQPAASASPASSTQNKATASSQPKKIPDSEIE
jgi:hypothetical protein